VAHLSPHLSVVATHPKPFLVCGWDGDWRALATMSSYISIKYAVAHGHAPGLNFRCCGWNRLDTVLASGSDKPRGDVLWTDNIPEKALEYGGLDRKVMLVYLSDRMERTYRRARASISPEERAKLLADYPTIVEFPKGPYPLWFSRLPVRLAGLPYETEHARWIPGDPFDALLMVIALGRNYPAARSEVLDAIERCDSQRWALDDSADQQLILGLSRSIPDVGR
jgi:hypothetical protein